MSFSELGFGEAWVERLSARERDQERVLSAYSGERNGVA
jgi:hypothetical protein